MPAASFLSGLLRAREAERIGCGPAGFIDIQKHEWFAELNWCSLLRKQLPAPWLPPRSADGAAASDADLKGDDVMAPLPFDQAAWAPIFDAFGPTVSSPIPMVSSTPETEATLS